MLAPSETLMAYQSDEIVLGCHSADGGLSLRHVLVKVVVVGILLLLLTMMMMIIIIIIIIIME